MFEHGGNTHNCGCPMGNCDCPTVVQKPLCEKHPTYKVLRKPTAKCLKCHELWARKLALQEQ